MADEEFELEMMAVVTIKTGQRLLFTPYMASLNNDDHEWVAFANKRQGEDCTLLGADLHDINEDVGEPALQMNALRRERLGPALMVRFEDGAERRIASRHFTKPASDD